jgi:hypothetical protein
VYSSQLSVTDLHLRRDTELHQTGYHIRPRTCDALQKAQTIGRRSVRDHHHVSDMPEGSYWVPLFSVWFKYRQQPFETTTSSPSRTIRYAIFASLSNASSTSQRYQRVPWRCPVAPTSAHAAQDVHWRTSLSLISLSTALPHRTTNLATPNYLHAQMHENTWRASQRPREKPPPHVLLSAQASAQSSKRLDRPTAVPGC